MGWHFVIGQGSGQQNCQPLQVLHLLKQIKFVKVLNFRTRKMFAAVTIKFKLELMFMKHYAPNRCLYIKVAKLRTGVGSAEMLHLQNRCLKISG